MLRYCCWCSDGDDDNDINDEADDDDNDNFDNDNNENHNTNNDNDTEAIFCGCYISVLTNLLLVHPPKRSTTMIYQICHFQMPVSTRIIYVP